MSGSAWIGYDYNDKMGHVVNFDSINYDSMSDDFFWDGSRYDLDPNRDEKTYGHGAYETKCGKTGYGPVGTGPVNQITCEFCTR